MIIEVWISKNGNSKEKIIWNPCNCCPNTVLRKYGNNFNKVVTYLSQNKTSFCKWMKSRNFERISRKVIK